MILRNIDIGDKKISYNLKRSKRAKYIRIEIDREAQLNLIVPERASVENAEKFIYTKLDWILKHQDKVLTRTRKKAGTKIDFFLFGKRLNHRFLKIDEAKNYKLNFINGSLVIEGPDSDRLIMQKLYDEWLRAQANVYIPARVKFYAEEYNFKYNRVTIKNISSKWGSCSSKGNLNFNLKLMKYRKEVVDYIVVHELCHLIEMNHSPKFWKLVSAIIPNYKQLDKELKLIY
ncbi:MAG: M48 family metallopeptidase [Melioribacteraceae bacterium]|nr:M48 family metallopeptidase [Melioribacteraceae bacterium]